MNVLSLCQFSGWYGSIQAFINKDGQSFCLFFIFCLFVLMPPCHFIFVLTNKCWLLGGNWIHLALSVGWCSKKKKKKKRRIRNADIDDRPQMCLSFSLDENESKLGIRSISRDSCLFLNSLQNGELKAQCRIERKRKVLAFKLIKC